MIELEAGLTTELPARLPVGYGNVIFLEGHCSHPEAELSGLEVLVDEVEHPVIAYAMPRADCPERSDRWWALIAFERVDRSRDATIGLRATLGDGQIATTVLADIQIEPGRAQRPPASGAAAHGESLIAICMATYRPPRGLFERQIASIRDQTFSNWVCLICDDGSGSRAVAEMQEVIGDDPRFRLSAHDRQLGFYGNFERALSLVPPEASCVALADQDDRWYPDKLEVLRSALDQNGANLAYSDMRIVSEEGELISETFWRYRANNFENIASLLIANTVTGAASLFRRELLDYALPLPPRRGGSFHDQWIAAVALALGTIAYVERPLYDYVQHPGAAHGFLKANKTGVERAQAGRLALPRRVLRKLRALISFRRPREPLIGPRPRREPAYFDLYMQTQLLARVLQLRCGPLMAADRRRAVNLLVGTESSPLGVAWLTARSLRPLLGGTETFARERKFLGAIAWRRTVRLRHRLRRAAARAAGGDPRGDPPVS